MDIFSTILSTQELSAHLSDPDWVIFDCRFDLKNPDWGRASYTQGHIPGAIYADLNRELSAPITPSTGRHPLPDPEEWIARLSSWGVDRSKQVVAYDTSGGSYAARMWWMLRWVGDNNVALLDGGYAKWIAEGRPIQTGIVTPILRKEFIGTPDSSKLVDTQEVLDLLGNDNFRLIDARTSARYLGLEEPIDLIAGHIPGAVNRFHGDNLNPDGSFLDPGVLREQFKHLLHDIPPQKGIVYCGSGVTSCHHLVAMELAGLPGARLYAGSWSEWIRDPNRPIASGQA